MEIDCIVVERFALPFFASTNFSGFTTGAPV